MTRIIVQQFKEEHGLSLPTLRIYDIEFHGSTIKDTTIITKNFGKLNDCFTFQEFQDFNNLKDFKIKNFVWSKKYGLVAFFISKGEKYELVEKTQTSK